jgi:hypothetical protein
VKVWSSARRPENEAEVVTDGAEDDIGGIAGATFEIAAARDGLLPSYVRSPPRWRNAV